MSTPNPLSFIELLTFRESWSALRLDDDDLVALQNAILQQPEIGQVIPGTGGLRKMRWQLRQRKQGKRAGARVCYVLYADVGASIW